MTTSHKVRSLLSQAHRAKSRRHLRLLRGRFGLALREAKLSPDLQDSALREFDRIGSKKLPY